MTEIETETKRGSAGLKMVLMGRETVCYFSSASCTVFGLVSSNLSTVQQPGTVKTNNSGA